MTSHESILFLALILQSLHFSQPKPHCTPSACGIIPNISFPFRLKGDSKHCGDRIFELACENNFTFVYLSSRKYHVKAINYGNSSIRLVDASINNDDICSFPTVSAYHYNFTYNYRHPFRDPYLIPKYSTYPFHDIPLTISFISCANPLKNSSLFTDITTHCASNIPRYGYIKVGHLNASEVPHLCGVEVIVMTSWPEFKDLKNASLSQIHHSLLYGFELIMCSYCGTTKWERILAFVFTGKHHGTLGILLVIVVFLSAVVGPTLMIIIACTGVFGYFSLYVLSLYGGNFTIYRTFIGKVLLDDAMSFY